MIGRTLAHYKINASLGAGGMGEVYRATDTRLGREIALKVLPPEMASDPDRLARFQREARAVAALNHPNVVTVYSVEEADNVHFITMELLEGQPLDHLISANGLPADRIIEIAGAIAEALTAAHEKGIVHRDLKPANVMVTKEGRIKVLDFGLAKDVSAEMASEATLTSAGHTEVGVVMGTPSYMSPEQVSGRPLDHRSDIFSFGVLLHEMSTGRRPFEGNSSAELISSILRDNPPSITEARPELPSDLARVIRRCLEKDPRYRMQTARDVSNEFRDLVRTTTRPASTASARPAVAADSGAARAGSREDEGFWVAVLPFKFKGSDPGLDALAEGITEEIITGMSRFPYLRVIAHGSTLRYANQAVDLRQVGKELGARYVMEGSLRQSGSRLRIAPQLVDTATGAQLWAETYDRAFQPDSIFELQDEVVPRIVSTVGDTQGILAQSMSEAVWTKPPDRLTPYEAVLRSFSYMRRVNAQNHGAARDALERAVEHAPANGLAWAMLSIIFREEYNHGFNLRPDPLVRALTAARRAVEAEPSNYLAHHALASVHFFRRELEAFRSETQAALRLNPLDGYTFGYLGMLTAFAGDWEHGCAMSEKARSLNPQHPGWYWFAPLFDAFRKQEYRLALDLAQKVNMPHFWRTNIALAATYGHLGETGPASKALQTLVAARPEFADSPEEECSKWWNPDLADQLVDGLHKAGLREAGSGTPQANASVAMTSSTTSTSRTASGEARSHEGFWVAVLPFKYTGGSTDLQALAEGLSEEVITGLSRFSYLRVIARGSTAKYSSESGDVRAIGKELGARYVMEASLRQSGSKLRLAIQLADTASGAQLWAETYERTFAPESVFEVQDDLVPRIVATVADQYGVLPRSMSESLRSKREDTLTPHEAVLRAFSYFRRITPEEHAVVRNILEQAVKEAPDHADSWAMLSMMYRGEFAQGFNPQPNSLDRALAAARRALELAPDHALGHYALATVYFFRKEKTHFRVEAERAMSLNPNDAGAKAYLGFLLAASGEWERGCQIVESAMQLNPNCPGYFYFARCLNNYRLHKYEETLEAAARINMPGYFHVPAIQAAALGQLGRYDEARNALRDLLALRPNFAAEARQEYAKLYDDEHANHVIDGLRKAGLDVPDETGHASASTSISVATSGASAAATSTSGSTRAAEGFWVAVLPFKYSGNNAELKALAEGLSEEVITGLSRFSYLRVIARGSTARYSSESIDVRSVAKELGARYVMEGSLRQAGSKLRLTVQLVDAISGAHLWAETYEHAFAPESVFELQDDLVPRIVATVADQYGVLPRSMSELLRSKPEDALTPHEAVLRTFSYFTRLTPEEHAMMRRILERAVREAPDHADSWAMLSMIYRGEHAQGFNSLPNPLDRALAAAQRAVDLARTHALGHYALATVHFFRKEKMQFRAVAERALALNPMDGSVLAYLGMLMGRSGERDRGCQMVNSAMRLNPHYPGWFHIAAFDKAYCEGKYTEALEALVHVNTPGYFHQHAARAAALGQLGQPEEAQRALQDLLALRPDFATAARQEYAKWYDPGEVEHMIDGLRKAGLDVPDANGPASSSTPTSGTRYSPISPATSTSGSTRTDEGFWVAVLPFKYVGANADLNALADGLTDDIVTGMSRFSYLRVIARSSTARYAQQAIDVRKAAKELGARYVMEGSIRQAGAKIRIAAQLVDAASGASLWAETYDRAFTPETTLDLLDDVVPRIVATVGDSQGILPRSMTEALRNRDPESLTPYEALLRSFGFHQHVNAAEHLAGRTALERAIKQAPDNGDCWAMLSWLYRAEYSHGYNLRPDPMDRSLAAARRAVELAPSTAFPHAALAVAFFFRHEFLSFRAGVERAIALNRMEGYTTAFLGMLTAFSGEWERGCALVQQATQLNPNHPGWYWLPLALNAYRQKDSERALQYVLKVNMPALWTAQTVVAIVYSQLGQLDRARATLQDLLVTRPTFRTHLREELGKWWQPEMIEQMIGDLRKAGLEIKES